MPVLTYSKIEAALVEALPEVRPAAERYWAIEGGPGEDPGPYIFYESMFGCYLEVLLASDPARHRDRLLTRAFQFVETMLVSTDEKVRELACVGLLEGRGPWWLERAERFLGSHAVSYFDEWFPTWRQDINRHRHLEQHTRPYEIIDLYSVRPMIAAHVVADGVSLADIPGTTHDPERAT